MEYNKLVAVSGLSGLFELVSSRQDGGVLKSLEDGNTKFVSSRIHSFSHVEGVEIYTTGENVNLAEIFTAMKASQEVLPDVNDTKAIKGYFEKVYPTMDFDRVYSSDMKKIIKWFNHITKHAIEIKLSEHGNNGDLTVENNATKAKAAEPTKVTTKAAPAKKINAPRKMA